MEHTLKKIVITDKDIGMISDFARQEFQKRRSFSGMELKEMQVYSILAGFESFLNNKGVEIVFELQGFIQEDSEPVDPSSD